MNDKEKQEFRELKESVDNILLRVNEMNRDKRNYTQNETFTERVTFRNRVNIINLPASATDLSVGDLYRSGTDVRVIT